MSDHRSREEKKEIVARNTLLANEMQVPTAGCLKIAQKALLQTTQRRGREARRNRQKGEHEGEAGTTPLAAAQRQAP